MASWMSVRLCVHVHTSGLRMGLSVCLCSVCSGVNFLSVCRLAEVSDQTRSSLVRNREHCTDTHTLSLQLHTACPCALGMARLVLPSKRSLF